MERERTTTLFWNGGSQAVRLPKEFRLPGERVRIRKEGRAIVLEPLARASWPDGFWEGLRRLPALPEDFRVPEPLPGSPHRDEALEDLDGS